MNKFKYFILYCTAAFLGAWCASSYAQVKPVEAQYANPNEMLVNGGFEQGLRGWSLADGNYGVEQLNTYKGNNHARITLNNEILDFSQAFSIVNEKGNIYTSCKVSTTISGVFIGALKDGSVGAQRQVDNSGDYNQEVVKDRYGTTSSGVKIFTNAPVTGIVDIDDCTFHDQPANAAPSIAVAATINAKSKWSTPEPIEISATTTAPSKGNTTEDEIKYYRDGANAVVSGLLIQTAPSTGSAGSGDYLIKMPDDLKIDLSKVKSSTTVWGRTADVILTESVGTCNLQWKDGTDSSSFVGSVYVYNEDYVRCYGIYNRGTAVNSSGSWSSTFYDLGQVNSGGKTMTLNFRAPIQGWSDGYDVAVQDVQLTAQTVNDLNAKILSAGGLQSQDYDWIQSSSKDGSNRYTVTFVPGVFTVLPSCTVSPRYRLHVFERTLTTSGMSIALKEPDAGFSSPQQAGDFDIECSKQGVDVVKKQTLVGDIEGINSTKSLYLLLEADSAQSIPTGSATKYINFVKRKDDNNIYNTTTDTVTIPRDGRYLLNLSGIMSGQNSDQVALFRVCKNGNTPCAVPNRILESRILGGNGNFSLPNSKVVELSEGDTLTFEAYHTAGLSRDLDANDAMTFFTLTEQADTSALIKNLNDNRNIKCQTKYLASNITSATGDIASLRWNNIDTSKYYSLTTQIRCVAGAVNCTAYARMGTGDYIGETKNQPNATGSEDRFTQTIHNPFFKPNQSTITHGVGATGGFILETGSAYRGTWSTLCQLPDNYIETKEWQ
jgi:hypothetical protein